MHLKRIAQAAWFNPASKLTDWIAGAKPRPGEMAFEHPLPSAYSSSRFAEYMANMRNVRCVLAGFSLDETILATVVDGFHRSHRYQVVGDAVACRQPGTRRCRRLQAGGGECDREFCYSPVQRRTDQNQRRHRGLGGRDRRMDGWDIVTGRSSSRSWQATCRVPSRRRAARFAHDGVSALDGTGGGAGGRCRR